MHSLGPRVKAKPNTMTTFGNYTYDLVLLCWVTWNKAVRIGSCTVTQRRWRTEGLSVITRVININLNHHRTMYFVYIFLLTGLRNITLVVRAAPALREQIEYCLDKGLDPKGKTEAWSSVRKHGGYQQASQRTWESARKTHQSQKWQNWASKGTKSVTQHWTQLHKDTFKEDGWPLWGHNDSLLWNYKGKGSLSWLPTLWQLPV